MKTLWYPPAIRMDGPAPKTGYANAGIYKRQHIGALYHSMEGERGGAYSVLFSTVQSSWHMTLLYTGVFVAHYPLDAVCWHANCIFGNMKVGVECEGRAGEPLTRFQVEALAEFTAWLAAEEGWPAIKFPDPLWEHSMMIDYGAPYATACPSGRIPWEEVIDLATGSEELKAAVKRNETLRRWGVLILTGIPANIEQARAEMNYVAALAGE